MIFHDTPASDGRTPTGHAYSLSVFTKHEWISKLRGWAATIKKSEQIAIAVFFLFFFFGSLCALTFASVSNIGWCGYCHHRVWFFDILCTLDLAVVFFRHTVNWDRAVGKQWKPKIIISLRMWLIKEGNERNKRRRTSWMSAAGKSEMKFENCRIKRRKIWADVLCPMDFHIYLHFAAPAVDWKWMFFAALPLYGNWCHKCRIN